MKKNNFIYFLEYYWEALKLFFDEVFSGEKKKSKKKSDPDEYVDIYGRSQAVLISLCVIGIIILPIVTISLWAGDLLKNTTWSDIWIPLLVIILVILAVVFFVSKKKESKQSFSWLQKIVVAILIIGALFYGVQFWKEPTLVTSFFKGIFQRKELGLDKWFGVNAGEKYSVIIGNNTLGVWPMIKSNDTVTVTVRNSEGTERYRIWNGSLYGRLGKDRLTPSLPPATGVFTFIFDKKMEVKLSTMPPK